MGVPPVAPALPGNVELHRRGLPRLVSIRATTWRPTPGAGRAGARSGASARRAGRAPRERMRERVLGASAMADAHERALRRAARGPPRPRSRRARTRPEPPPTAAAPRPPGSAAPRSVSVVVPCFNHGRYLPECIESIRAQTWPEVEIIVVDDASTEPETDACSTQLEATGASRVLRRDENSGPSSARNRAIELARARYVLPVDADNLLLPGRDRALVAQLRAGAARRSGSSIPNMQYFGNRQRLLRGAPVQPVQAHAEQLLRTPRSLLDRLGVRRRHCAIPRTSLRQRGLGLQSSSWPSGESGARPRARPRRCSTARRASTEVRLGGVRRRGLSRGHPGSPSLALRARGADKGPLVAGPVAHPAAAGGRWRAGPRGAGGEGSRPVHRGLRAAAAIGLPFGSSRSGSERAAVPGGPGHIRRRCPVDRRERGSRPLPRGHRRDGPGAAPGLQLRGAGSAHLRGRPRARRDRICRGRRTGVPIQASALP